MAFKIAYLKSRDVKYDSVTDAFVEFAKERGVEFEFETHEIGYIFPADSEWLKKYDAIIVQGAPYNRERIEDIARNLGLVTKCAFKEDFQHLSGSNQIFVTCISPKGLGEFRTTLKIGREAVESARHCELEIERATRHAYEFAEKRRQDLTLLYVTVSSVVTQIWDKVVSEINEDYPSVKLSFENGFEHTFATMRGDRQYDVVLMVYSIFDALSQATDKDLNIEVGASPIAYLGDTAVGMYATENPAAYSPFFDALAISKMLENSFDLPALAKDWKEQISKVYCKTE